MSGLAYSHDTLTNLARDYTPTVHDTLKPEQMLRVKYPQKSW